MNALKAELYKASTLPAVWAGFALTVVGCIALEVLLASQGDVTGTDSLPMGTVGAAVIGVVAFSSEYTANSADAGGGRQITTTLTTTPSKTRVLLTKALTIVILIVLSAVVAMPVAVGIARPDVPADELLTSCLGATLYWVLSGLLGFAITVVLRNGVIPLILLILNSSLVSVSLLLTKLTSLAYWLPDLAGRRLFGSGVRTVDSGLDAVPGGLVMAGWAVLLCLLAGFVFARRDA
ncbi:ABC transporter permease [Kribbella antibiotica]|uniref:ABC transporter permease n=1 Tax=Kribbella antibiotica TaxID=190195 RepID=A0A4R4ZTJ7_9ACTN|nr:ABC transporter permease [Kribbella antibiotica]TDD62165.1 ABC transporter permease [Kribbella antibiotica]